MVERRETCYETTTVMWKQWASVTWVKTQRAGSISQAQRCQAVQLVPSHQTVIQFVCPLTPTSAWHGSLPFGAAWAQEIEQAIHANVGNTGKNTSVLTDVLIACVYSRRSQSMRWTVFEGAILYWWQMGDWGLVTKLLGFTTPPPRPPAP